MPRQAKSEPVPYNPKAIRVEIFLPLPPKELSGNSRAYYMKRAEKFKGYKHVAFIHIRNAMQAGSLPKMKMPVTLHLEYFLRREKGNPAHAKMLFPQDEDNARTGAKAAQDALEAAGFVERDSAKQVRTGTVLIRSCAGKIERGGHGGKTGLLFIIEGEPIEEGE